MFGNHTPYDGVQRYRAGGSDVALLDKLCDTFLWCLCRHRGHLLRSRDQSATLMAAFTAARRLSGTDAGSARREAGLFGGERAFSRLAPEIAQRFGVCFDHNMLFESEVIESAVTAGVISVANAAKTAVETTLLHMATTDHADYRASLWNRLDKLYPSVVERTRRVRGATDDWEFDAVVNLKNHVSLFEIVTPHANAVNSAVAKFLDIRDLGDQAPHRIAVLTQRAKTPHLPLLARTARLVNVDDLDQVFQRAA